MYSLVRQTLKRSSLNHIVQDSCRIKYTSSHWILPLPPILSFQTIQSINNYGETKEKIQPNTSNLWWLTARRMWRLWPFGRVAQCLQTPAASGIKWGLRCLFSTWEFLEGTEEEGLRITKHHKDKCVTNVIKALYS